MFNVQCSMFNVFGHWTWSLDIECWSAGVGQGMRAWENRASKAKHSTTNCPYPNPLPKREETIITLFG